MKNVTQPGSLEPTEQYRKVFIVGPDIIIDDNLAQLYTQNGCTMLRIDSFSNLGNRLQGLKEKVNKDTVIDLMMHGIVKDGVHYYMNTDSTNQKFTPTTSVVQKISQILPSSNLHIHSCHIGAAKDVAELMPDGSTLMLCGGSEKINQSVSSSAIKESFASTSSIEEIMTNLTVYAKQTMTLCIKKNGQTLRHSFRAPREMLNNPEEIGRFFEHERNQFIEKYNALGDPVIDQTLIPRVTKEQAIVWQNDYLIYSLINNSREFAQYLNEHQTPGKLVDLLDGTQLDFTPIVLLANKKDTSIISSLINAGISIDSISKRTGNTALIEALAAGNQPMVNFLLREGADINLPNVKTGELPLMVAIRKGNLNIIDLLIKNEVNLDQAHVKTGGTALHQAVKANNKELVLKLLDNGARIDAQNTLNGNTPLIQAVISGNLEMVQILMDRNPALDIKNNQGFTAQNMAFSTQKSEILNHIENMKNVPGIQTEAGITHRLEHGTWVKGKLQSGSDFFEDIYGNNKQIQGMDPTLYIMTHPVKIGKQDAIDFIIQEKLQIGDKSAIQYAIDNAIKIRGQDAVSFATKENIKIKGHSALEYATEKGIVTTAPTPEPEIVPPSVTVITATPTTETNIQARNSSPVPSQKTPEPTIPEIAPIPEPLMPQSIPIEPVTDIPPPAPAPQVVPVPPAPLAQQMPMPETSALPKPAIQEQNTWFKKIPEIIINAIKKIVNIFSPTIGSQPKTTEANMAKPFKERVSAVETQKQLDQQMEQTPNKPKKRFTDGIQSRKVNNKGFAEQHQEGRTSASNHRKR